LPDMTLHPEYTSLEFVQYKVSVRVPRKLVKFQQSLYIRLSQPSTLVTCSLEAVRPE